MPGTAGAVQARVAEYRKTADEWRVWNTELVPKTERFFRLLTQRAYVAFQQRMLQNLSLDAEKRYVVFRDAYPEMDRQIAQKHLASYLGMSAEFLSKVKKRVVAKAWGV